MQLESIYHKRPEHTPVLKAVFQNTIYRLKVRYYSQTFPLASEQYRYMRFQVCYPHPFYS